MARNTIVQQTTTTVVDPNRCRNIILVSGINGVAPGGVITVTLPVDRRYHRAKLQCSAVNYSGVNGSFVGQTLVKTSGVGVGVPTATLTVNTNPQNANFGVITAAVIVAGGTSGFAVNDTL